MGRLAGFSDREVTKKLGKLGFNFIVQPREIMKFGLIQKPIKKQQFLIIERLRKEHSEISLNKLNS